MDQTAALCFDSSRIIIIIGYHLLSICVYFIMHAARRVAFVPRHWFSAPFNFWPRFVSALLWLFSGIYLQNTRYRTRGNTLPNAVLFWNFKRTASDSICQSAACWWIYCRCWFGKKRAWWILTDMSPFRNAEWRNQNVCVRCLRCGQLRVHKGQDDCVPGNAIIVLVLWFSKLHKELACKHLMCSPCYYFLDRK